MAGTTITDLTEGAITSNDDCFVIDTADGETVKIKYADLITALVEVFVHKESYNATISQIFSAINGKQDKLTFDDTPTANSVNPCTSGGIYSALQNYVTGQTFGQAMGSVNTSITNVKMKRTRRAISLPASGWDSNNEQTVTANIMGDSTIGAQYQIYPNLGEQPLWNTYGVYLTNVTGSEVLKDVTFTFKCVTVPVEDLSFQVLYNRCELLN